MELFAQCFEFSRGTCCSTSYRPNNVNESVLGYQTCKVWCSYLHSHLWWHSNEIHLPSSQNLACAIGKTEYEFNWMNWKSWHFFIASDFLSLNTNLRNHVFQCISWKLEHTEYFLFFSGKRHRIFRILESKTDTKIPLYSCYIKPSFPAALL